MIRSGPKSSNAYDDLKTFWYLKFSIKLQASSFREYEFVKLKFFGKAKNERSYGLCHFTLLILSTIYCR